MAKVQVKEYLDGDEIDLSLQCLTSSTLPTKELAVLKKGKKLDLSKNQITRLPESFVMSMTHLVKLDLSGNGLLNLPEDFGNLQLLQHLDLYNNQLIELPVSCYKLKSLKWLDVKDNELTFPPESVLGLCRNDVECKKAASVMLQYMKEANRERETMRQKDLAAKRAQKEALKKELERLEELEKMEKKKIKQEEKSRDKARRKAEYEAKMKEINKDNKQEESIAKSPEKKKRAVEDKESGRGVLKIAMMIMLIVGVSLLLLDPSIQAQCTWFIGLLKENTKTALSQLNVHLHSLNKQLAVSAPALQKSLDSAGDMLTHMLVICNDTLHLGYQLAVQEYKELSTYIEKKYL